MCNTMLLYRERLIVCSTERLVLSCTERDYYSICFKNIFFCARPTSRVDANLLANRWCLMRWRDYTGMKLGAPSLRANTLSMGILALPQKIFLPPAQL